jgi:DNA topoisomerase-1
MIRITLFFQRIFIYCSNKEEASHSIMKNLVIVESAAKAKIIQKYLNDIPELKKHGTFKVIASFGHICDLPSKELGIEKRTWTPTYAPLDSKKAVIAALRKAIEGADRIWIASDLDMEGEAIAYHIKTMFHLKRSDYARITFNEITKNALRDAVLHPRGINMDMVHAQEARRMLDRVIGYELSPLLWRRFATPRLSAGRVQSAALRLIHDKERESKEHEPVPHWDVLGTFHLSTPKTDLVAKADASFDDPIAVRKALRAFANETYSWVATFSQHESKRSPNAPFVTSTLQQEAYNRLGLPAKRTMQIAQALYESGHITYMRTDSPALSDQAQNAIAEYIERVHGTAFVHKRQFKSKAANAQEAHECIRPTHVDVKVPDKLQGVHKKLYDLIWRRAIASQMSAAKYIEVRFQITSKRKDAPTFKGQYDILVEPGYMKVYNPDAQVHSNDLAKWERVLNQQDGVSVTATMVEAKGDVSRPPALYNEPALIRTLERIGIGRPSTYSAILDKIFQKGYVLRGSNPYSKTIHVSTFTWKTGKNDINEKEETIVVGGTESDKIVTTSLGERVIDYLDEVVPFLIQPKFTAEMETELDAISDGKKEMHRVLDTFYDPFNKAVEKAAKKKPAKPPSNAQCKLDEPKKNVIREFVRIGANILQTRYGPAVHKAVENKWVSLMPFMRWRQKTLEDITEADVRFLLSLPMQVNDGKHQVLMGRYGLYMKDASGVNYRLDKKDWDSVYDGKRLNGLTPIPVASQKKKRSS